MSRPSDPFPPELARYHRQMLLADFGVAGQKRLSRAHALVVGCGALGTMIIDTLARAGVGTLTIVDRDLVEITNLQRQVLFDESDVEAGMPKAEAARLKVQRINSQVTVHAHVDDFNHASAERLAGDANIILDGLDNFETRYLVNDLAVSRSLPYLYGGAVGTTGMSLPILPHPRHRTGEARSIVRWEPEQSTPCLRCVFPEPPPPGSSPTCDTAGVLAPAVSLVAARQCAEALKLLTGHIEMLDRAMLSIDVWTSETRRFEVDGARTDDCPCCGRGEFEFLRGAAASATTSLCGRNAVQVIPATAGDGETKLDLAEVSSRLAAHGDFSQNDFLLQGTFKTERGGDGEPLHLTLFVSGRAIIKGTTEPEAARTVYAKYVGA